MATNKFFVIRRKGEEEYCILNPAKTIMFTDFKQCTRWPTMEQAKFDFNQHFRKHQRFEIVEVLEKAEYTLTGIPDKPELSEVLSALNKDQIDVLVQAGLKLPAEGESTSLDELYSQYKDSSSWVELNCSSVDVGAMYAFLQRTITRSPTSYPVLEMFVFGDNTFGKELGQLVIHIDEDGDVRFDHPTRHWDYWRFPLSIGGVTNIMDDIETQYREDEGIWSLEYF